MTKSRKKVTIGALVGAAMLGIGGILLGTLVIYSVCGSSTDVNVYGFCAAKLLGIPISALLGACLGFCPSIILGALAGGAIVTLVEYVRSKASPAQQE